MADHLTDRRRSSIAPPPREFGEGFVGASVVNTFGNILSMMYVWHYLEAVATR